MPEPAAANAAKAWGIVVAGVGGTGVITIGRCWAWPPPGRQGRRHAGRRRPGAEGRRHLEPHPDRQQHGRDHTPPGTVAHGQADLVIACDAIVAAKLDTIATMRKGRTHVALNTHGAPTAKFVNDANWVPGRGLQPRPVEHAVGAEAWSAALTPRPWPSTPWAMPSTPTPHAGLRLAKGWMPLSKASMLRAIELNGVQVPNNKVAFEWGRRAARPGIDDAAWCRSRSSSS